MPGAREVVEAGDDRQRWADRARRQLASPGWRVPAALGVAALILYGSTIEDHPGAGDGPESVAGVRSVGILHAPGYPVYVLLARAFTLLVPLGSFTWRVNLFSAVCAAGAVVGTYLIARRVGATVIGAVVGALSLATGTSFWFYAGFAKHTALTAFALVLLLLVALRWAETRSVGSALAIGVCMGLLLGDAWQIAAIASVGLLALVLVERPLPSLRQTAIAVGAAVAVGAAAYGFVVVRAGMDPALNWGRATTLDRLVRLLTLADFGETHVDADWENPGLTFDDGGGLGSKVSSFGRYVAVLAYETSVVAALVGGIGLLIVWRNRAHRGGAALLCTVGLVNLAAAAVMVGIGPFGIGAILRQGGFLLGTLVALAVGVAVAVSALEGRLAPSGGRRRRRAPSEWELRRPLIGAVVAGILLVLPVIPSHATQLERRLGDVTPAFVDDALLPLADDAVLMVYGSEKMFPLWYAQIVEGMRPDVELVLADGLVRDWYREEAEARLGIELPPLRSSRSIADYLGVVAEQIEADEGRPVYFDVATASRMRDELGYRPTGLMVEFEARPGRHAVEDLDALDRDLAMDRFIDDEFRYSWPNRYVGVIYKQAQLAYAQTFIEAERYEEAERHLAMAFQLDPEDEQTGEDLEALRQLMQR